MFDLFRQSDQSENLCRKPVIKIVEKLKINIGRYNKISSIRIRTLS